MTSGERLRVFERLVQTMDLDESAEQIVRDIVSGIARSCPQRILSRLAECVVDCRREELKGEAELN